MPSAPLWSRGYFFEAGRSCPPSVRSSAIDDVSKLGGGVEMRGHSCQSLVKKRGPQLSEYE